MATFFSTNKINKIVTFDEDSIASQKSCIHGPSIIFDKKSIPFYEYLTNVNVKGSLGCGPEQFPNYENGKYFCSNKTVSNQCHLDYVNNLLEAAMQNVGYTVFGKNKPGLDFLINRRNILLDIDSRLQDNLELEEYYVNIEDWYKNMEEHLKKISSYRPDPEPEFDKSVID